MLGISAVTKMSAMRGVVHVGILLVPILIVGVSSLVLGGSGGVDGRKLTGNARLLSML